MDIAQQRQRLLEIIKKDAYFREKITLSSGKESDYYVDARLITLTSEGVFLCASLILDAIKDIAFDALGGPTLGADPVIGAINVLAHQQDRELKTFIIRKEPKGHGRGKMIEGPALKEGARVIVIDDVATTGKAFLRSIEVLSAMKVRVERCISIVDRDEGAAQAIQAKGSRLLSLFRAGEIHVG